MGAEASVSCCNARDRHTDDLNGGKSPWASHLLPGTSVSEPELPPATARHAPEPAPLPAAMFHSPQQKGGGGGPASRPQQGGGGGPVSRAKMITADKSTPAATPKKAPPKPTQTPAPQPAPDASALLDAGFARAKSLGRINAPVAASYAMAGSKTTLTAAPGAASRPNKTLSAEQSTKGTLLVWAQAQTRGYAGVSVSNFSKSWADGLAFCALMHAHYPQAIGEFGRLKGHDQAGRRLCFELAFRVATERTGVPAMLDVEDMMAAYPRPDDKSVIVYLSLLYQKLGGIKRVG